MTEENKNIEAPVTEVKTEAKATEEVVVAKKVEVKKPVRKAGPVKLSINRTQQRRGRQTEFEETVIDIARVTTFVKGGRRFSFSAFVVVGNRKGKVG